MSRKITVGAALALALLMVAASIPLTMLYAQQQQNKLIPDLPKLIEEYGALKEIQGKISDYFYRIPAGDAVNAGMVRGYIAGLGDSGSRYLNAEEYQAYMDRLEGRAPELGIVLKHSTDVMGLVIDQVKAGSTAYVSGLRPGDHIIKAESGGKVRFNEPEVMPNDAAEQINKFYEATSVTAETSSIAITITYKRGGDYMPPAPVMLGSSVSSVSTNMLETWAEPGETATKAVGYIKIHQFFRNTADQIEAAVKALHNDEAQWYILDVRDCSEGDLESARRAIDLFANVPEGGKAIATLHYRTGDPVPLRSTVPNIRSYIAGGMVVLINERTSGVAELFAHDLRAFNINSVVLAGENTKGINTIQEPFPLASVGGAALLTVGTVVPYLGDADWNKDGVQPGSLNPADEKLNLLYRVSGAENQLKGALQILYLKAKATSNG